MSVSRADLAASLAVCEPEALKAILLAAELDATDAEAKVLAERITEAIWWNYSTPLGYAAGTSSLEAIVAHVSRRLRVYVPGDLDGWGMIHELTKGLLEDLNRRGIRVDDLPPTAQARLGKSWGGSITLGAGSASSAGAWYASGKVAGWLTGPIGRWLPYIPKIGPWIGAVGRGAVVVHAVSGPLAIAMGVLSVNSALGTNYRRLVPLLLGVGALAPQAVAEAQELPRPGPTVAEA
jgi:hypothetical protein